MGTLLMFDVAKVQQILEADKIFWFINLTFVQQPCMVCIYSLYNIPLLFERMERAGINCKKSEGKQYGFPYHLACTWPKYISMANEQCFKCQRTMVRWPMNNGAFLPYQCFPFFSIIFNCISITSRISLNHTVCRGELNLQASLPFSWWILLQKVFSSEFSTNESRRG